MKAFTLLLATASLTFAATASLGQFVKGNEAVAVMPDGSKRVETPALPPTYLAKACPVDQIGCASGGWKMLETPTGLMECTELYARPGTCRASTYGTQKRPRIWVVKSKGAWLQCQYPDLGSKCGSIKSLPYDAIQ
jgi:hypothetical protein